MAHMAPIFTMEFPVPSVAGHEVQGSGRFDHLGVRGGGIWEGKGEAIEKGLGTGMSMVLG